MQRPEDYSDAELADAWIYANDVTGDDSCFWATEEMMGMPYSDPERAWRVILAIVEREPPRWVLGALGAGPLEDLLRSHGPEFIERIEDEAYENDRFYYEVLTVVYPQACKDPAVADRLRYLRGDVPG